MIDSCYNYFEFLVAMNLTAGRYGYNSYPHVLAGLQCTGWFTVYWQRRIIL